ncbi:MAG TPA: hypothetical protein VEO01_04330 [Pseudonocardiaceae bacterium]|nr:hypothetical protein [Pseudonocardiaceae bacterium]
MNWRTRTARRGAILLSALACIGTAMATMGAGSANAVPIRNSTPWSILLCKFVDQPQEPQPPSFFANFLTGAGVGMGGLADYYADQSDGLVSLSGSVVQGWYTESYTLAQDKTVDRWTRSQHCVDAAAAGGYTVPAGSRVITIINAQVDSGEVGGPGGRVVLDPLAWDVGFAAHEMGHSYGLNHSFSNDTTALHGGAPGEYDDPWDEMSAMNIFAFNTPNFSTSAVGLAAYQRDKLGWLPINRVVTVGSDGVGSRTVTLAPLEVQSAPGPLLVRIPFDPADLNHYYTVEFRRQVGWSRAIPGDTVLIHEVQGGKPTLIRDLAGSKSPVQSLNANGVQITVNSVSGNTATVSITTDIVNRCLQGYVWRQAIPSDHVCVTPAERSQVAADNAAAPSRWVNGAFGPHTCVNGFVWREAFTSPTFDDVCVTPDQRSQAAADNAAAASRINPARLVFGPNACQNGFVWRQADSFDYACVTSAERSQVAADNAAAPSRWVNGAFGPHTCVNGFVWREAFHNPTFDDVCVTPAQRSQAAADNAAAASRVLSPNG